MFLSSYPLRSGRPRPRRPALAHMANIRTDLAVSPSFSRSGKTAASVNAQAMGQLKKELELASRKAARGKVDSLNASHAEILSRVLDSSITGVPPAHGFADVSREKDLCSSPREQTTWCGLPYKSSACRVAEPAGRAVEHQARSILREYLLSIPEMLEVVNDWPAVRQSDQHQVACTDVPNVTGN